MRNCAVRQAAPVWLGWSWISFWQAAAQIRLNEAGWLTLVLLRRDGWITVECHVSDLAEDSGLVTYDDIIILSRNKLRLSKAAVSDDALQALWCNPSEKVLTLPSSPPLSSPHLKPPLESPSTGAGSTPTTPTRSDTWSSRVS